MQGSACVLVSFQMLIGLCCGLKRSLDTHTSKKSRFVGAEVFGFLFRCIRDPFEKLRISFSVSRIKLRLPPVGENMTVNRGQAKIPKQHDRSGFPADLGQSQKGVLGTVVTIATPSVGSDRKPLYGYADTIMLVQGDVEDTRRMETILSNGTSISMFPIQNRSAPSSVTSTDLTKLYQNQANTSKLATDTATTVPWAPIGTAATNRRTKIISSMIKRSLNPKFKWTINR